MLRRPRHGTEVECSHASLGGYPDLSGRRLRGIGAACATDWMGQCWHEQRREGPTSARTIRVHGAPPFVRGRAAAPSLTAGRLRAVRLLARAIVANRRDRRPEQRHYAIGPATGGTTCVIPA